MKHKSAKECVHLRRMYCANKVLVSMRGAAFPYRRAIIGHVSRMAKNTWRWYFYTPYKGVSENAQGKCYTQKHAINSLFMTVNNERKR